MHHYRIPAKVVRLIQPMYVTHNGKLSETFEVKKCITINIYHGHIRFHCLANDCSACCSF